MDKTKGWIKLYRSIEDHWLWDEPFNYQSAWIDLLMLVNHEPNKVKISNEIIEIKPGQRWTSIRKLGLRWKWKEEKVLKFLKLLESDGMIYKESNSRGTLLTIVNYEDFQGGDNTLGNTSRGTVGSTQGNTSGNTSGRQTRMKKNEKNEKNEKEYSGGIWQ